MGPWPPGRELNCYQRKHSCKVLNCYQRKHSCKVLNCYQRKHSCKVLNCYRRKHSCRVLNCYQRKHSCRVLNCYQRKHSCSWCRWGRCARLAKQLGAATPVANAQLASRQSWESQKEHCWAHIQTFLTWPMRMQVTSERANSCEGYIQLEFKLFYEYGPCSEELITAWW